MLTSLDSTDPRTVSKEEEDEGFPPRVQKESSAPSLGASSDMNGEYSKVDEGVNEFRIRYTNIASAAYESNSSILRNYSASPPLHSSFQRL